MSGRRSKPKEPCTIDGCEKSAIARGYCHRHWYRWSKFGDPLGGRPIRDGAPLRFATELVASIDHDDCIIWPFTITPNGYGYLWFESRAMQSHRVICILTHGRAPSPLQAAHQCGNAACCNPRHIRWATPLENNHDKFAHGTNRAGEAHENCRLTDQQVAKIRRLASEGVPQKDIAALYQVSATHVCGIINGRQRKKPSSERFGAEVPDAEIEAWRTAGDIVASARKLDLTIPA